MSELTDMSLESAVRELAPVISRWHECKDREVAARKVVADACTELAKIQAELEYISKDLLPNAIVAETMRFVEQKLATINLSISDLDWGHFSLAEAIRDEIADLMSK